MTEVRVGGAWLLGHNHPATHAFVTWRHADGPGYRVEADGEEGTTITVARPGTRPATALWQLRNGRVDVAAAVERAVELVGSEYDYLELAAQAVPDPHELPGLVQDALRLLGMAPPVRLATAAFVQNAFICTSIVAEVLIAAGGPAADLVRQLPDRFPERVARALEAASDPGPNGWISRF